MQRSGTTGSVEELRLCMAAEVKVGLRKGAGCVPLPTAGCGMPVYFDIRHGEAALVLSEKSKIRQVDGMDRLESRARIIAFSQLS